MGLSINATSSPASVNSINNTSDANRKSIFVAITGSFKFSGDDRTSLVSPNGSPTEKIFLATQAIARSINQKLDAQFIGPSTTCETSVKTAADFVNKHYQKDDSITIYGYSNGGRCAMDVVTELQKQQRPVDLLVTVDATDAKSKIFGSHNKTVDVTTPSNVKLHQNFYQADECSSWKCPSGAVMQAESPASTTVLNHQTKLDSLSNEEYKAHIHRYMETINKDEILQIISSTLKAAKMND